MGSPKDVVLQYSQLVWTSLKSPDRQAKFTMSVEVIVRAGVRKVFPTSKSSQSRPRLVDTINSLHMELNMSRLRKRHASRALHLILTCNLFGTTRAAGWSRLPVSWRRRGLEASRWHLLQPIVGNDPRRIRATQRALLLYVLPLVAPALDQQGVWRSNGWEEPRSVPS